MSCVKFSILLPASDTKIGSSAVQNGVFHLRRVPADHTLVGTVSPFVDLGRPGLNHSIAILCNICPRLSFWAVLSHFVVFFFPILACTFCLSISPRRIQRCHFQARFVTFCSLYQNLRAYAAPLVNNKNAESAIGSQPRVSICISQCLSRLISKEYSTTRCSPVHQRTRFIVGKV